MIAINANRGYSPSSCDTPAENTKESPVRKGNGTPESTKTITATNPKIQGPAFSRSVSGLARSWMLIPRGSKNYGGLGEILGSCRFGSVKPSDLATGLDAACSRFRPDSAACAFNQPRPPCPGRTERFDARGARSFSIHCLRTTAQC